MITYTRLYSDAHGESHFEDVEIDLTLTEYAPPAPPLELSSITPAKQFGFMNTPAGWASDWHPSAARNMFFCPDRGMGSNCQRWRDETIFSRQRAAC